MDQDTADRILSMAEDTWTRMGLTKRQIAFGMGLMDIESGFNAAIYSPSKKFYGLGQFDAPTWKAALKLFNKHYHTDIKPSSSPDPALQIAVLGNWIQQMLWPRAEEYSAHSPLSNSGYSLEDIAYAFHNKGHNSTTPEKLQKLRDYLDHEYKIPNRKPGSDPDDYGWMNTEVLPKAHRILGIPDNPPGVNKPTAPTRPAGPRSSLEAPSPNDYHASIDRWALPQDPFQNPYALWNDGAAKPAVGPNLLTPGTSPSYVRALSYPYARQFGGGLPSGPGSPIGPGSPGSSQSPARYNRLTGRMPSRGLPSVASQPFSVQPFGPYSPLNLSPFRRRNLLLEPTQPGDQGFFS